MKILGAFSVPLILLALSTFASMALADKPDAVTVESARAFFTKQMAAIKAGDLAAVKAGLSARQKDKVTAGMVTKAKGQAGKMTVADLVDKVEASGKIKMKNGRTLTTMIKEGGNWVADTIWFK